jgi:hypothetical protein
VRRTLIPIAVGIGLGVFVAGFLAYFTVSKESTYWVDGLGRPLDTAPWLARFVFGADKEWAGWAWLFIDLLWFWGGIGLAVFLGSLAGERPAASRFPKSFVAIVGIIIALSAAYSTQRVIKAGVGLGLEAGLGFKPTPQFLNEPEGFRQVSWGTPINAFSDLIVHKDELPIHLPFVRATRNNENLNYAGVKVESINYFFTNNVLSSVTLMVYSEEDFKKLKEFCFSTYGSRKMDAHDLQWKRQYNYPKYEKYRWEGANTIVEVLYTPNYKGSYYGQLAYISKKYRTGEREGIM